MARTSGRSGRRRSPSSHRWLREHFSDSYVKRAHGEGARSRAVFKLEEIDQRERLLRPGQVVVDLGAAPGAWSQYVRQRVGSGGRVIACDLLAMAPISGVQFLQGDIREAAVLEALQEAAGSSGVDVLLSDMAPNLSGIAEVDAPRAMQLVELALELAQATLKLSGAALIKVLQGAGFEAVVGLARRRFERVKLLKPRASRARSPETYLLASGKRMV